MISGDVLKYRKGLLIPKRYETCLTASSRFPLTLPPELIIGADDGDVFGTQ